MTYKEKVKMYKKLKKRKIINLLINCQDLLYSSNATVQNIPKYVDFTSNCLHDNCNECNGTGIKANGGMCIHNISCSCNKCSPTYGI